MPARPPADLTPARFFEEWLPGELRAAPAASRTVRVRLDGDGGGVWDLALGPSGLRVVAGGAAEEPDVTLAQTVADWRALAAGEPGAMDLLPPRASPAGVLLVDRAADQLLSQVAGTLRFEVTGYNGRTWALVARLGKGPVADPPDATISVDAETYAAILARTLPPAAAFFQGKVKISGDANLAMQLGMALMPRPA